MEAFESSLASSSDACTIPFKFFSNVSAGTTPAVFIPLNPASLGGRVTNISLYFTSFKIQDLLITFLNGNTGPTGNVVVGVLDDAVAEGDVPTTASGLSELRCSGIAWVNQTVPSTIVWKSVDRSLWYKVYAGATGSDTRLTYPGTIYYASDVASQALTIMVEGRITFKGAVDTLSG